MVVAVDVLSKSSHVITVLSNVPLTALNSALATSGTAPRSETLLMTKTMSGFGLFNELKELLIALAVMISEKL